MYKAIRHGDIDMLKKSFSQCTDINDINNDGGKNHTLKPHNQ